MDVAFFLGAMFGFMVALLSYELATAAGEDRVVRWLKRLWPNERPYLIRKGEQYGVAKDVRGSALHYNFTDSAWQYGLYNGTWTDRETAETFIANGGKEYERVE